MMATTMLAALQRAKLVGDHREMIADDIEARSRAVLAREERQSAAHAAARASVDTADVDRDLRAKRRADRRFAR